MTSNAGGVNIYGLAIDRFNGNGLVLNNPAGSLGDTVYNVNIGTDRTGATQDIGNTADGIFVQGPGNFIGGPAAATVGMDGPGVGGVGMAAAPLVSVIGGNGGDGIDITGPNAVGNTVTKRLSVKNQAVFLRPF